VARGELRGTDGRGRPRAGNGSLVLTASELRVAQLVVGGMRNLEVADALSISKRTVDTHLANLYRKLGIRSRASLGDALRGLAGD
jgi:DNA-binding CsgD family transcriptional regulator